MLPPLPSLSASRALLLPTAAFLFASLSFTAPALAAGAVLTPLDQAPPSFVDIRTAVAVTPTGSTRWNELTLPAGGRALWLVPVKPGATVEWVPRQFLNALDEATAPRIVPPSSTTTCPVRTSPEVVGAWSSVAANERTPVPTIAATADAVLSWANGQGYRVSTPFTDALTRVYADGWRVAMVDAHGDAMATTFGTLRVTDDAGAALPLSLASGLPTALRMTTFTIGSGEASLSALYAADVVRSALTWGPAGSNYRSWRDAFFFYPSEKSWLRESSSHEVMFDGVPVLGGASTRSVAEAYFGSASCAQSASSAASSNVVDASAYTCAGQRDLALALSAALPSDVVVGRWAATIPASTLGTNIELAFTAAPARGPVFRAQNYEQCAPPAAGGSAGSTGSYANPSGISGGSSGDSSGGAVVPVFVGSEGCGSSEPVVTDDPPESASEGCGSSDSSSGSTSDDSSDSSDGWDDSDDDSDDSCSSKHDSSSSSDSCSGSKSGSSSGGSDDGWDTEDEAAPKTHTRTHAFHKPARKRSSPVSRIALLGVALILPFRRRGRPT